MIKLAFYPTVDLIEAIGNEPQLYKLHLGLDYTPETRWHAKPGTSYWLFIDEDNGRIVGMLSSTALTDKMLDVHIYILPKYWGTDISNECADTVINYLREESNYNILLTACPAQCTHAQKFIERVGFKKNAILKNAMTYADKVQDMYQYAFNLRDEE